MILKKIDELKGNEILARNIMTWDYQIILPEGAHIRREYIEKLKELGVNMLATKNEVYENSLVKGFSFCITGALSLPRKEYENLIEKNGGKNVSSVTSKTSYLVTNDTTSGSSKNKKAQELGVRIISEDELKELLGID